jgi:hypothetical protein
MIQVLKRIKNSINKTLEAKAQLKAREEISKILKEIEDRKV